MSGVFRPAPWMSFGRSPENIPASGSLEVNEISLNVTPGQLSVTVMEALMDRMVWFAGTSVDGDRYAFMYGGWLSVMVTDCVAVRVVPDASIAVHVTIVVPTGNRFGALFVYVTPGQLSETIGVPRLKLDLYLPHT